jgi:hypothetical protein
MNTTMDKKGDIKIYFVPGMGKIILICMINDPPAIIEATPMAI